MGRRSRLRGRFGVAARYAKESAAPLPTVGLSALAADQDSQANVLADSEGRRAASDALANSIGYLGVAPVACSLE